ncbi:MAG: site-2 protease family protein [Patescibacteria group bacterium]|nr:site-2 protease family protein [Patescibacteria group bacterium]
MEQAFLIAFYLVTLLYSIILHEVSHGVVALWLGDKTAQIAGRLSLEPLRHIDPIGSIILPLVMILTTGFAFGWAKPVPYNPYNLRWQKWGGVAVAFAGPITNFTLALIAAISASFINISLAQKQIIISQVMSVEWGSLTHTVVGSPWMIAYAICAMIIFWNVLLGTFNLLPFPPLDGSKLIFTLFNIPPQVQMFLERWGFFLILLLLMIPVFQMPFSMLLMNIWQIFYNISF